MNIMTEINKRQLKKGVPHFRAGDTVCVMSRVKEGEKERVQAFEGVVISRKGSSINESFTVRKVSYGVGVERVFLVNSPMIERIDIKQKGAVRRAKLYYIRELSGRAARIEEKKYVAGDEETVETEEPVKAATETAVTQ
ncbi:MAG: 50S ribosomal protein L19 [Deltaproteobacteria bacterium CG11_big_fil_rev_8_21_14_0_20_49_13]|nr:MAG: 50S ribosomal protein L19 [Deltaproteobacteria bacterium CG11_big_fil_rev_8_21_14_0_20_49_13]